MRRVIICLLLLVAIHCTAQQYRSPLGIPLLLSGNCGELRNNHFHSGLDIKTQGVTGKSVYSIEDGYVSRIAISPAGYGLALYIDHPSTGHTSVYGHLESFAPNIAAYIKKMQYEQESFRVNLILQPTQFPVKKGDIVAYTGNTGGSGGPHLHFEIRDTRTENVLDPLEYFRGMITDTRAPEVRGIAAYPVPGRGVVNGTASPLRQSVSLLKNGIYSTPQQDIEAWGLIGLGIKAYDRMDGATNIYGVRAATLFVDGRPIFKYDISHWGFGQTRMINTFTDFADWRLNKSFFMQSFVEPGNALPFYKAENSGYINISEERPYNISYELQDIYDNKTTYNFTITGKKQEIIPPSGCSLVMEWNEDNRYISEPFSLIIPRGNLYNNICFTLSQTNTTQYYSNIFNVNNTPVALDQSGEVSIKMQSDPLDNKSQYGIVQINKGGSISWVGGTYKNGTVTGTIRELGVQLAVFADTKAPVITPVVNNTSTKRKTKRKAKIAKPDGIRLKVTDNLSGVASFSATIDGKFALFEHDIKSPIHTYKFDPSRLEKGQMHKLVFTATDACGNTSEYTTEFEY